MSTTVSDDVLTGLVARTERRRVEALGSLSMDGQSQLGQFFTPSRAATLIAALPTANSASGPIRILDPGAGAGSLAAALAARLFHERIAQEIEIVAVEVDATVEPYLISTLEDIRTVGSTLDIKVVTRVLSADFVELSTGLHSQDLLGYFDYVIMNPPYKKLGSTSPHRKALHSIGVDCSNIYAAFLALGVESLKLGGQITAITPRSFANGPYFRDFRAFLLDRISIDRIHVFESRSTVFSDTGVLQENIIVSGTRGANTQSVTLSASVGHTDEGIQRNVPRSSVIHDDDAHSFIRIPSNDDDTEIAEEMASQPCTLSDLGLRASTGKVVDFRARDRLLTDPGPSSAPLIYPANVRAGWVGWPRSIRKPQYFAVRDIVNDQKKFLLPAGNYVVIKRFSSKEERRRVVAGIWDSTEHDGKSVAFENHVNVLHAAGSGIDRDLALGLMYWLNCSLVDSFFRIFSGHTQVNATDLRTLRFPRRDQLEELGRSVTRDGAHTQEEIDAAVASVRETAVSH